MSLSSASEPINPPSAGLTPCSASVRQDGLTRFDNPYTQWTAALCIPRRDGTAVKRGRQGLAFSPRLRSERGVATRVNSDLCTGSAPLFQFRRKHGPLAVGKPL